MPRRQKVTVISKDTADYFNRITGRKAFQSIHDDAHPFSRNNLAHLCGFVGMSPQDTDQFLNETDKIRDKPAEGPAETPRQGEPR